MSTVLPKSIEVLSLRHDIATKFMPSPGRSKAPPPLADPCNVTSLAGELMDVCIYLIYDESTILCGGPFMVHLSLPHSFQIVVEAHHGPVLSNNYQVLFLFCHAGGNGKLAVNGDAQNNKFVIEFATRFVIEFATRAFGAGLIARVPQSTGEANDKPNPSRELAHRTLITTAAGEIASKRAKNMY